MKDFRLALGLTALLTVAALAPRDAAAQIDTRRGDRYSRTWDRNEDRDLRGSSIETLARRTERESNAFREWFERNYRSRRLGRSRDNRWLKGEIQSLDEAMERVRSHADDRRPERGRSDVEDAMDHARRIDRELIFDNDRDTRFTNRPWVDLRLTLDRLARAYNVRRF